MLRKTLTVSANVSGWYLIKTVCDEGLIITNVKLEAGKPIELSFVNDMRRDETKPVVDKPSTEKQINRPQKQYRNNRYRGKKPKAPANKPEGGNPL